MTWAKNIRPNQIALLLSKQCQLAWSPSHALLAAKVDHFEYWKFILCNQKRASFYLLSQFEYLTLTCWSVLSLNWKKAEFVENKKKFGWSFFFNCFKKISNFLKIFRMWDFLLTFEDHRRWLKRPLFDRKSCFLTSAVKNHRLKDEESIRRRFR